MAGASFADLSAPGARVPLGASGHHWLDAECPLLRTDVCRIPPHVDLPPTSPVPEPATALLLLLGLIAVTLRKRAEAV